MRPTLCIGEARRRTGFAAVLITLILGACSAQTAQPVSPTTVCKTQVFFSRDAATALIKVLEGAQQGIHVAMYGLSSRSIVDALIAAKSRGVDVAIKTDKKESEKHAQATLITKLKAAGVTVKVSTQQRNLHDKFAVIDGQRVITGSFNWTVNAEQLSRENLIRLSFDSIHLPELYLCRLTWRKQHENRRIAPLSHYGYSSRAF